MKAVSFLPDVSDNTSSSDSPQSWSTPEKLGSASTSIKAMKTPGITIPTPMACKQQTDNVADIDDSAFLPDDFRPESLNKENVKFNMKQVQEMIDEAVERDRKAWMEKTRRELDEQNQRAIEQIRRESETQLTEHGRSWQEDHLLELEQVKSQVEEEKRLQQAQFHQQMQQVKVEYDTHVEAMQKTIARLRQEAKLTESEHVQKMAELEISSANTNSQYCKQIEELKNSHDREIEELQQTSSRKLEKEIEARNQLVMEHEDAVKQLLQRIESQLEMHKNETDSLRSQNVELAQQVNDHIETQNNMAKELVENIGKYENQIRNLVNERDIEIENLRLDLTSKHQEEIFMFKSESIELQTVAANQIDELQLEIRNLLEKIRVLQKEAADEKVAYSNRSDTKDKEMHAEIDELKTNFELERKELTEREEKARSELNELETKAKELEGLVAKYRNEIDMIKLGLQREFDEERTMLKSKLADALANEGCNLDREKNLLEKLSEMEVASKKNLENFDLRVKEVRMEHAAQIDEMLAQLDLVEAEHGQRYAAIEKSVIEKDAIISALGSQLAEAQHRQAQLESENELNASTLSVTEEELRRARKVTTELEKSMEELRVLHKIEVDDERRKGQALCDQVRNETIAAAEEQFSKANEHYITLKHEYDSAIIKIGKLEKELRAVRRDLDNIRSEGVSRQAAMASELAQSKAALATAEASTARKVQDFQANIEKLQAAQRDIQIKLEDANVARHAANVSLAAVLKEKEKLIKENADLNSVCEELMAMVEGGQITAK